MLLKMKKSPFPILFLALVLLSSCDSLYFADVMPKAGQTASDFPWEFPGEYRMVEVEADSSITLIRIEEMESKRYSVSFSDSGLFRLGFIMDLKQGRLTELNDEKGEEPSELALREYKDAFYLSWFKEEYKGWKLVVFDIGPDSLKITIPQFDSSLLSDYKDVDQNDFLCNASDEELEDVLAASATFSFVRISELKQPSFSYFILGGIALFLFGLFIFLGRRKK